MKGPRLRRRRITLALVGLVVLVLASWYLGSRIDTPAPPPSPPTVTSPPPSTSR
jgi:hypothetical protein